MPNSKKSYQSVAAIKSFAERFVQKHCYPLLPYPKTRFVIITNGRTGSNYLVSLLLSHPEIYQYGEVIGESNLRRQNIHTKIRACGSVRYVRNCYRKRFYKKAVGVKILYYQFKKYYAEKWGVDDLQDVFTELREEPKILVIHLKRRNQLKTLVSMELARLTKEYVKREANDTNREVRVHLTPERCTSFFQDVNENEKYFDECFGSHKKLEIYYEDLVTDTETICKKIMDFLQVKHCELKGNTFRQSQRPVSQHIQNFEELKQFFKSTPSAVFFED